VLVSIFTATVAIIPVTATVVILVVAIAIRGKVFQAAFAFTILIHSGGFHSSNKVLHIRVQARTLCAVTVLILFPTIATTVTTIPVTTAIVVVVIAIAIFDVKLCSA